MAKYPQYIANTDGWTDLVIPAPGIYKMCCCDCGLVHNLKFSVIEISNESKEGTFMIKRILRGKKIRSAFKVSRNNRATGQVRRGMKSK